MAVDDVLRHLQGRTAVAVFGSGEPRAGDPEYEAARQAAARLARAGIAIINGGYGGVMEASSRGARESGGIAIGVTVDAFQDRGRSNEWLTHEVREADLFERTRTLVEPAAGFLVLPGKAGTLAEAAFLWALTRAGLLGDRPVVLAGEAWQEMVARCRGIFLDDTSLGGTRCVADADAGAALLCTELA